MLNLKCNKLISFALILTVSIPSYSFAQQNVVPGTECPKVGKTQVVQDKKFTCIKLGKKLIWDKGFFSPEMIAKNANRDYLSPRCKPDPNIPAQWKEFQKYAQKTFNRCESGFVFKASNLSNQIPVTKQTSRNKLLSTKMCKLNMNREYNVQEPKGEIINPDYKLQIIPFQTPDYQVNSNPQIDYKYWFEGMEDMIKNMSDVPASIDIIIPNKYFKIPKTLKSYDVGSKWLRPNLSGHPKEAIPNYARLVDDVVKIADPYIDFSAAKHIWVVGPPNTKRSDLFNYSLFNNYVKTNERTFERLYVTDHPYNYEVESSGELFTGRGPIGQWHEWFHSSGTLTTEMSMGVWGITAGMASEMIAWDKWMTHLITDDQVRCASKTKTTIHWLKPSSIKGGTYEKLLMIPYSKTKAIALESIRSIGYNYKIPKCQTGVLVYTIDRDLDIRSHQLVQNPKPKQNCQYEWKDELATFQKGDSFKVWNTKITILESGEFGDVVQVDSAV